MLLLALLLAASNDGSLRWLGAVRWKCVQKWNYEALALTAVHALASQALDK